MQIWIIGPLLSPAKPGSAISLYSNKSPTAPGAAATHCSFKGLNKTQSSWHGIQLQQGRFYGLCNHRILWPSLQASSFLSMTYTTSCHPVHPGSPSALLSLCGCYPTTSLLRLSSLSSCAECRREKGGESKEREDRCREKTEAEVGRGEGKVRENCIKSLRKSDGDVLLTQPKERARLCF